MARKGSKSMKKRTHKGRRHRGGGWGFTGPSSIPGTPGTVSNPQVFTGIGDCRAVKPGYDIPTSDYSSYFKGLPGMNGGKRRKSRKGNKRTRKQRGGRYGFFPESIGTVTPNGAAWWAGTYPPIQRIACEGSTPNPLNPTHTPSTAPPGAANPDYWMKGGAQTVAPATYGVGNVDSMYYYAPTAGYANTASTWKDSVGAPVQIQVPYAAREMNQACLSTGGHPPLTGALQKGGKRTRRHRKQRGGEGFWNLPGVSILGKFFGRKGNTTINGDPYPVNNGNANNNAEAPVAMPLPNNPNVNVAAVANQNANMVAPPVAPAVNGPALNNVNPAPPSSREAPIVVGGRKRRHRKHKKMTHKRKH